MTNILTSIAPSFSGRSQVLPHVQQLAVQSRDSLSLRLSSVTTAVNITSPWLPNRTGAMAGFLHSLGTAFLVVVGCSIAYIRFWLRGGRIPESPDTLPPSSSLRIPNDSADTPKDKLFLDKPRNGKFKLPEGFGKFFVNSLTKGK